MMGFTEAIETCFRKYITFSGRAPRAEFWWWYLFCVIASIITSLIDMFILGAEADDIGIISSLFSLATLIPSLAVGWRRLHDISLLGIFSLLPLAGMILGAIIFGMMFAMGSAGIGAFIALIFVVGGFGFALYFGLRRSTPGENRFGPHPYGEGANKPGGA